MSTSLYLKKSLQTNVKKIVTIKKRGGSYPETDFNTKQPTGKMTFLYVFADEQGNELKHYAKEREEETLKLFSAGDKVQVVLQEMMKEINGTEKRISFLVWSGLDGVESSVQPLRGNTAQTKQDNNQYDAGLERKEHDWKLGLAGIVQAMIIAGATEGVIKKDSPEWAKWIRETAKRLSQVQE